MSSPPPRPSVLPRRVCFCCQPGAQQAVVEAGGWELLEQIEVSVRQGRLVVEKRERVVFALALVIF